MHSSAAACTGGYNKFRGGTESSITVEGAAALLNSSGSRHQVAVLSFTPSLRKVHVSAFIWLLLIILIILIIIIIEGFLL